jgi:hypothetical protein
MMEDSMAFPALKPRLAAVGLVCVLVISPASRELLAQSDATAARVARDADVQGAQRLFTAWLEGQMLSRHLPGVVVGVVADQELIR